MIIQTHTRNIQHGFTLIELMIVVAVVGILTSIAYPAFTEQIAKGRRAEARATLLIANQWTERFYTENYRYDKNSAGTEITDSSLFPSRFSTSPTPGQGVALYDINIVVTTDVRDIYRVQATRKAGTAMASDKCGDFTIDQLGRRSIDGSTWSASAFTSKAEAIERCWK
jgi:type IV pilus assembly protein PilE